MVLTGPQTDKSTVMLGLGNHVPIQLFHLKALVEIKRSTIDYTLGWFNLENRTRGAKGKMSQSRRAGGNLTRSPGPSFFNS